MLTGTETVMRSELQPLLKHLKHPLKPMHCRLKLRSFVPKCNPTSENAVFLNNALRI